MSSSAFISLNAQTADEIITNFLGNTGGLENWQRLNGFKLIGEVSTQTGSSMESIQLKDGRQMMAYTTQGQEIKSDVYDSNILWNTNTTTMRAEVSDTDYQLHRKRDIP